MPPFHKEECKTYVILIKMRIKTKMAMKDTHNKETNDQINIMMII
jgi:hypothetical protein